MDERMTSAQAWARLKAETDFDYAMHHAMQPDPVPTGVAPLDAKLGGGLPVGTFTVIAGEAGCGKSALACCTQYNAGILGKMPVFFSMEMPAHMVISRLLSVHTSKVRESQAARGVPDDELMRQVWWSTTHNVVRNIAGHAITDTYEATAYVANNLFTDPVLAAWDDFERHVWRLMAVDDKVSTVSQAIEVVDGLCKAGIRPLVILDYLQLGADTDGEGSEYERVTKASGQLAACVKRWQIPAMVISSMRNVGREERKDAPTLSMLRSSGRIGFDAGTVVILKKAGERDGSMQPIEAHIVKNRVGPSGDFVPLLFNGGANQFT